jgi:uncharacterized membrane protein
MAQAQTEYMDDRNQVSIDSWSDSTWFKIMLLTAIVLGILFRWSGLGNKIYSHDEAYTSLYAAGYRGGFVFTSLWDGEIKKVDDVQKFLTPNQENDITQVVSLLALYSPHQAPLYYIFAHYWMRIVGYKPDEMRGLAALFGCLSIFAMYQFAKELFQTERTARISTILFSLSPFHILFAQDARPYSLWTLITLLSSAVLLRAIKNNKLRTWVFYSITLVFGMYTHQLFVLIGIVHFLYLLGILLRNSRKKITGFLLACFFALFAYAPWLYFLITRWHQAIEQVDVLNMRIAWYRFIQRWILLFSSPVIDFDFNSDQANLIPYILRVVVLLIIAYAFFFLLKHSSFQEKLFLVLVYSITAGIFIALDLFFGGIRSITGRYFVPANTATILVMAYFITTKLDQTRPDKIIRVRFFISSLILVSIVSNFNILYSETWWNKEISRIRTEFIHEIDQDQAILIATGYSPTNLGDILSLGLQVKSGVHFRLYRGVTNVEIPINYASVYLFPSSYDDVLTFSTNEYLQIREVISGSLWTVEGRED